MHTIEIGAQVPRWHNAFVKAVGLAALRLLGWRLDFRLPDLPKFVIIGAPHTSNWDAVIGVAAIFVMQVRINWWVKHTVFRWPFKSVLDWFGGIPVHRGAAHDMVGETVEVFRTRPQIVLGITPEGTRRRADRWKKGFYRVAHQAGVPIVLGYFDYRRKVCGNGPVIVPTGNYEADTAKMLEFYRGVTPRYPENYSGTA
jgi:1-acyl-sn-glycerol-3-phosphate acyltransferase